MTRTMDVMKQTWAQRGGSAGLPAAGHATATAAGTTSSTSTSRTSAANGLYGYCAPERTTTASTWAASGYCVLDDDFARSQFGQQPILSLKATAAHEFFHAVQFAYDYAEDGWFMEATATWMEERVFDDVNDNRQYLPAGQLGVPGRPLDTFQNAGARPVRQLGLLRVPLRALRQRDRAHRLAAGRSCGSQARPLLHAGGKERRARRVLAVFGEYATSNTAPSLDYPEGRVYPGCSGSTPRPTPLPPDYPEGAVAGRPDSRKHVLTDADLRSRGSLVIDHLASRNVLIKPGAGIEAPAGSSR